jgi:uncharacterized membrane protein YidH (DUF202 family)
VAFLRVILTLVLLYNPLKIFSAIAAFLGGCAIALLALPVWDWANGRMLPEGWYIYRSLAAVACLAGAVTSFSAGLSASLLGEAFYLEHGHYGSLARAAMRARLPQRIFGIGALSLAAGLAVYGIFAYEHWTHLEPVMHWKWFAAASLLVIVGIQLLATGLTVRLIDAYLQMREGELKEA